MIDDKHSQLEQRLRRAMRPVEPPAGFAENVVAALGRVREQSRANSLSPAGRRSDHSRPRLPWLPGRPVWFPATAAAGLAAVLVGAGLWNYQRAQQLRARQARAEVVEALRISSQTLNEALHTTVNPSRPG
jgi:hypothetical protein